MANDLIFSQTPATTQPIDLVFGQSEDSLTTAFPLTLAAGMPALGFSANVAGQEAITVAAQLPKPNLAADVRPVVGVTLAASLPALGFSANAYPQITTTLSAQLPALGLQVSLQSVAPAIPSDTNLLFDKFPNNQQPVNLVFGEEIVAPANTDVTLAASLPAVGFAASLTGNVELTLAAQLPTPVLTATVAQIYTLSLAAQLPGMQMSASVTYDSNVQRPLVNVSGSSWQDGSHLNVGQQMPTVSASALPSQATTIWQHASPLPVPTAIRHQDASRLRSDAGTSFQAGTPIRNGSGTYFQDAIRLRSSAHNWFQDAYRVHNGSKTDFQDGTRRRSGAKTRFQDASRLRGGIKDRSGIGKPLQRGWQDYFQPGRALPIAAQPTVVPPTPVPQCYTPDGNLLFGLDLFSIGNNLVFRCDADPIPVTPTESVIVPVRKVYIVLNNVSLMRVQGSVPLSTINMSIGIDVDSWTWSFSANLTVDMLPFIQPAVPGEPVMVEAAINGVAYRFNIETRRRSRSFGQASIAVSGRGINSILDAPYAPITTFANSQERSAQQLMNDVLTTNGVSLGWSVNWGLTDWQVPAGVFVHQGTFVSALNAIAGAAGGYIQPHRTAQQFNVLPRYPATPWNWSSITPDYVLPAAVTTVEGIDWMDKADYNRVFVSGSTAGGVLTRVTRTGTAGEIVAPMVTDALITSETAGRQRGIAVLSDTGAQAKVSLRLPVLAETGIIQPGKFVKYVESVERFGIVRSTHVEVGMPEVWQTLEVETHV